MAYGSMTICEALRNVGGGTVLLPAIQRKFVWDWRQIEALFDSLMQRYPINTFMFWRVSSPEAKTGFRYYRVLDHYVEKFATTNPLVATPALYPDFDAVIDGQQRLTSLYIGLCGTYAYKLKGRNMPRIDDENILPRRRLYLDLVNEAPDNDESGQHRKYIFRFLRDAEVTAANDERDADGQRIHFWYPVGDILNCPSNVADIDEWSRALITELEIHPRNGYWEERCIAAAHMLVRLHNVVFSDQAIHYYREETQDIDNVLDLFVRTNSGGTKLEFADLLMSLAIRHWDGDARVQIDGLVDNASHLGFDVSRDWVLKASLYLTGARVKFRVASFTPEVVQRIQADWNSIRTCILNTLGLLQDFGYKNESVRAKNAILTVAYYLFRSNGPNNQPLYLDVRTNVNLHEMRASLIKWMNIIILKHSFGAQSDNVLEEMRNEMNAHLNDVRFPVAAMIQRYAGTNRDLRFDDAAIDRLMSLHKGNPDCRALLMLLRPDLPANMRYDIDHLHPHNAFKRRNLNRCEFLNDDEELKDYYADAEHWDTVPNLHLLDFSTNRHKSDNPLSQWANDPHTTENAKAFILVPADCSLEFDNFRNFFETRKEVIRGLIRNAISYVDHPLAFNDDDGDSEDDGREEVDDEENDRINAERRFRRNLEVTVRVLGMDEQTLTANIVDGQAAYDLLARVAGEHVAECRQAVLELLRRNMGLDEAPLWSDIKREFRPRAPRPQQGDVRRRRDTTKYNFNGQTKLNHQEMVEAVIVKYIEDHRDVNLNGLELAFPRALQGPSLGCIVATDSELFRQTRRSSFRERTHHLADGTEIAIVSEWGRAWGAGNIPRFLERARELGYRIEEIPSEGPAVHEQ